jgi:hypothetical protein
MNNLSNKHIEFLNSTVDSSNFTINDVADDNACMYRSIANYIYYATPHTSIHYLKRFKDWGKIKNIEDVLNNYGYFSEEQDLLARFIQKLIVRYIILNPSKILKEYSMSIENLIPIFHDITITEYIEEYEKFAGDERLNKNEYDRWGSLLELNIISEIIGCPIIIFNSQKFDNKTDKITNGKIVNSKPHKDVRFRIMQIINKDLLNKTFPIFLIWKKYNNNGHFMPCYPNSESIINNIILEN